MKIGDREYIYIETQDGIVNLTKTELEIMLKKAYDDGYSDGSRTILYPATNPLQPMDPPWQYPQSPFWWEKPYCTTTATSTINATKEKK